MLQMTNLPYVSYNCWNRRWERQILALTVWFRKHDGASVMSGHIGGVQKLFCHLCGREVPYIHCYCHRLILVVDDLLANASGVSEHFSTVSDLYDFFKINDIKMFYSSVNLKRLIETRWSGHFQSIKLINNEIEEIIKCFEACQTSSVVKYGNRIKSGEYLKAIKNPYFILLNKILYVIFTSLNIATYVLQGKAKNLLSAMQTIEECKRDIERNVFNKGN